MKSAEFNMDQEVTTRFKDVEGIDAAKDELEEIVDFLKTPEKYFGSGARIPRGALLAGEPGTGKTLLALSLVNLVFRSSSVPPQTSSRCLLVSEPNVFESSSSRHVRTNPVSFSLMKSTPLVRSGVVEARPAMMSANRLSTSCSPRWMDSTTRLVLWSSPPPTGSIFLTKALLRPGRFDRKIQVSLPSVKGRLKILGVHARDKTLASDVRLKDIAKQTTGFSGADLANLLNECAIRAVKDGDGTITKDIAENVYQRIVVGAKGDVKYSMRKRNSSPTTKRGTPSRVFSFQTMTVFAKFPSCLEVLRVG